MAEQDLDAGQIEAKVLDLREAMERLKQNQADQDDVVVEMRHVALSRRELLARDLEPLAKQVPEEDGRFEFGLARGETPRLWIDMTTHVRMARDRRTYELVKDTRLGRTILARGEDRGAIGRAIADYVAGRLLERERELEGEWQSLRSARLAAEDSSPETRTAESAATVPAAASGRGWLHLITFLLGIAAGAVAMVVWAWFGNIPDF